MAFVKAQARVIVDRGHHETGIIHQKTNNKENHAPLTMVIVCPELLGNGKNIKPHNQEDMGKNQSIGSRHLMVIDIEISL